jgi:hypothetical protein
MLLQSSREDAQDTIAQILDKLPMMLDHNISQRFVKRLQECILSFRQHLGRYGKVVDVRKQDYTVCFHDLITVHRLFHSFQLLGFDDGFDRVAMRGREEALIQMRVGMLPSMNYAGVASSQISS